IGAWPGESATTASSGSKKEKSTTVGRPAANPQLYLFGRKPGTNGCFEAIILAGCQEQTRTSRSQESSSHPSAKVLTVLGLGFARFSAAIGLKLDSSFSASPDPKK